MRVLIDECIDERLRHEFPGTIAKRRDMQGSRALRMECCYRQPKLLVSK
jgi:hypothetical protein